MNQPVNENRNKNLFTVTKDVSGLRTLFANLYFIGAPGASSEWLLIDAGVGRAAPE